MPVTRAEVFQQLTPIQDPEIHLGIVDLGLIYDAKIEEDAVTVVMTLTSPTCPFGPELIEQVKQAVITMDGVSNVEVEVTFDPPWNPYEMASEDVKDELGIW